MTLSLHHALGSIAGSVPVLPLRSPRVSKVVAFVAVLTVILVGVSMVVYPRIAGRLGIDLGDEDFLSTFRGVDGVVVDEDRETVTLPGGVVLDGDEREAVAAAYDYLERRPGATGEEVIRVLYRRHPAGHDDPEEWWSSLVSPAVEALAASRADRSDDPYGAPFDRHLDGTNP